jgi:hypothetical protein
MFLLQGIIKVFSQAYYFFVVFIKQLGFFSHFFITDLDGLDPHDESADVADDLGKDG